MGCVLTYRSYIDPINSTQTMQNDPGLNESVSSSFIFHNAAQFFDLFLRKKKEYLGKQLTPRSGSQLNLAYILLENIFRMSGQ